MPSGSRPARGSGRGAANGHGRDHVAGDRRKKTRVKQDRPPRFKRLGSGRGQDDDRPSGPGPSVTNGPSSQEKDSPNNGTSESSPTSPFPPRVIDGADTTPTPLDGVHSSDLGGEEWETASDNSEYINAKQDTPEPPEQEQPMRRDVKPSSARGGYQDRRGADKRGRGRGGNSDRGKGRQDASGNFVSSGNAQIYTLHSIDYTNQSAIDEALRDASANMEDGMPKLSKKAKQNEELFKLYDLHNYASVVNVDDLPDVSHSLAETMNEQTDFLPIPLDQPGTVSPDLVDDEGFTPVLSKKELRKREQQRKREEGEKVSRRAKEQQKQQRQQRLFNKTPGSPVSGASGSIKQSADSKKGGNNIWSSSIGTWDPKESQVPTTIEAEVVGSLAEETLKPDNPSSQHDSGVESSVPSSQRSSPGSADPKVTFSTFGNVSTTTGVITSVSSVIHLMQSPELDSIKQNVADFHQNPPMISDPTGSPRSVGSNPAGAIGGERGKRTADGSAEAKQMESMSLEMIHSQQIDTSIHSLFNNVNDKNAISFIADNTDDEKPQVVHQPKPTNPIQPVQSSLFNTPSDHQFPSAERNYTPFGELTKGSEDGTNRPTYSGIGSFKPEEGSLETKSSFQPFQNPASNPTPLAGELPQPNIPDPPPLVGSSPSRPRLGKGHSDSQLGGFHSMGLQSMSQTSLVSSSVLDSIAQSQKAMENPLSEDAKNIMMRTGVGSNPEVPSDMTDSEQDPGGSGVARVPGPIPMPPKHPGNPHPNPGGGDGVGMGQNPAGGDLALRGQSSAGGDLGLRGQNPTPGEMGLRGQGSSAGDIDLRGQSSAGKDMSLLTPTSPSVDFNLKMESARKAWENSGQQQGGLGGGNPVSFSSFHASSLSSASSSNISQTIDTSTAADVQTTFNVDQSREWKPQRSTPSVGGSVDQSSSTEPNPGGMKVVTTSAPMGAGAYRPESQVTTRPTSTLVQQQQQQQQQSQIVSPVVSPYQLMLNLNDPTSQLFTPSTHRVVQQASTPYQPISSTSLHNNLQQMQQAAMFNHLPGALQSEYSLMGTHGYSSLSHHQLAYNPSQRDYPASLFLQAAQTTVVTPPVKAPALNTVALKPQSHAMSSRTAAYGTAAGPSINLNLAHRSASSAGSNMSPVTAPVYLPAFGATQRQQHSTSFYNQLNQTSGYYAAQAQPTNQQQARQAAYQQQQQTHGVQYQPVIQPMNKAPSPPLSQTTHETAMGASGTNMMGAAHSNLGLIGTGHGGSYAVAPPNARTRTDGDFTQSQMYMPSNYPPKNTNFPPKQPTSQSQDTPQMGAAMKGPPYNPNYMMGQKPPVSLPSSAGYGVQKPPTPVNQPNLTPTSQGAMKYPPFSQNQKTFAAVDQQIASDRAKQGMSLQFRQNQVQGLLSRPYSGDTMSQSAPSSSTYMPTRTPDGGPMPQPTGQMPPPYGNMQPRPFPANQWGGPMQGAGKPPQQMGPNMGMVRPPMDMMGKPQRMPMNPQQRFMPPQQFQMSPQQMAAAARTGIPFRPPRMQQPNQQMNPPFGEFHAKPPMPMTQPNMGPKPPASSTSQPGKSKIPPIPSLVCGVQKGLDASGKKPQYIPIEKVKEQQTEGRMSLLSSISSFFKDENAKPRDENEPDPRKMSDDAFAAGRPRPGRRSRASKNAGKAAVKAYGKFDIAVTSSSDAVTTTPTVATTTAGAATTNPGAATTSIVTSMSAMTVSDPPSTSASVSSGSGSEGGEPAISVGGQSKRTGPIGGPTAAKKPLKAEEPAKVEAPAVKKMTLADTRPKKGEVVQIALKETL